MTINSAIQKSQVLYYTIGKLILSEAQKSAMFRPQLTGKKRRKEKKRGEVLPDLRATQKTATCKSRNNMKKCPNLCEYKFWFLPSSKVMLERRVQIQLNAWWSPSKLLLQAKCNILALLTHQKTTVCVSVPSSLQCTPTGKSPAPTVRSSFLAPALNIYFHECFS